MAHRALTAGETLEGRFREAETAATALAELTNRQEAFAALKDKVRQADRARALLDMEAYVERSAEEAREAVRVLSERTNAARLAADAASPLPRELAAKRRIRARSTRFAGKPTNSAAIATFWQTRPRKARRSCPPSEE